MTAGPLIDARAIRKEFGGLVACHNIDFTIERGSIVSLIGPNGAGKTTFFNILTGAYTPTAGEILFDGHDIVGLPQHKITALGIGRTFQNIRLFGTMTALENVLVGMHSRLKSGLFRSLLRTPAQRHEEGGGGSRRASCSPTAGCPPVRSNSMRGTWPTVTSAVWRSPARSRRIRSCCCWTSRPQA